MTLAIGYSHFFSAVLGRNDSSIRDVFEKYDLVLPDGYGVYLAGKFLYGKEKAFRNIFNGTDLYDLILKEANLHRWRIFFIGETEKVLEALQQRLHGALPGVVVAGTHHGFFDLNDPTIVPAINASKADILMIGMGTPKQDMWLWNHSAELQIPVMMTVGAGIRFMSGEKVRAAEDGTESTSRMGV